MIIRPGRQGRRAGLGTMRAIDYGSFASISFTPKQLSGLILWLRSDAGIVTSSGTVTDWADLSGANNNVTQATALKRPAYVTSDSNFGGKPSLTFTSLPNASALDNTVATPVTTSSARTLFAVVRATLDGATNIGGTILDWKRGAQDFAFQHWHTGGTRFVFGDGFSTNLSLSSPPTIQDVNSYVTIIDSGTGGTLVFRMNGINYTVAGGTIPAETAGVGFTIGNRVTFGQSFNGSILEIVALNRVATATEYKAVESYFKRRYSL